ncbi:MAG: tRNA dihydrouridine synthase DusB [Litorimonas sp.]
MANPVHIGKHALRSNVLVAPMSGVTDLPFRKVLQRYEPGLVVSEMVASERLAAGDAENLAKASGHGFVEPLSIQLVGRDPYWMAEGAKACAEAGADIIDINMGCPARKVTGALSGSALMREPKLALEIIKSVVDAVDVPVTLKMRLGWDHDSLNAAEIAVAAEALGVVMFVVHGRTRCQFYKGEADWAAVRSVVNAVDAPVFVNGDVFDASDAVEAIHQSGAAGVMVGRSLVGRPWDIAEIRAGVDGGLPREISPAEKADVAVTHYRDIISFYPEAKGIRFARKHLAGYCDQAGLGSQDPLRVQICQGLNAEEVADALSTAFLRMEEAA